MKKNPYSNIYVLDRGHLRCSICNCVNSLDISEEYGENYTKATMELDPRDNTRYICSDCNDAMYDYESEDEEYENIVE